MGLPTPPGFSNPIPNPSPTIPNVPAKKLLKGPYWYLEIADAGISVSADGTLSRTGSSTSYATAKDTTPKTDIGHLEVGNGLSVVGGDSLQVGTGAGTIPYYIETEQGWLLLGNGFYVDPATGNLTLD